MASDYDQLGGQEGIHRIITEFIDRVYDDFIIGFLFQGKDRTNLIRREVQFAASHLGGPSAYGGRPLGQVHRPLKINRGHFRRRLAILRTVLHEHKVSEEVIDRWLSHDEKLMALITTGEDCTDGSASSD